MSDSKDDMLKAIADLEKKGDEIKAQKHVQPKPKPKPKPKPTQMQIRSEEIQQLAKEQGKQILIEIKLIVFIGVLTIAALLVFLATANPKLRTRAIEVMVFGAALVGLIYAKSKAGK